MTTPAPAPAAPAASPARGISIAGVVLAFLLPIVGLILSIVGLVQNRAAGQKIGINIAGIVISIVFPIVIGIIFAAVTAAGLGAACAGLEPGVYDTGNGGTLTCG